jgi:hypothetical protein
MIISHQHRYVFVEVPHTASHSIAEQLIAHYAGRPILRKHANLTQFLRTATADEAKYFKFATVRHPLDAIATDYFKLAGNHKGQFTNPAALIERGGHVTKQHLREFNFIKDTGASFPAFFGAFRNKLYNNWFLVGEGMLDYVIRFESLQEGFSEVLRRLGIEQREPLGHVNPTLMKRKSWVELYTPDTYQQAARCVGPFMKKWNYEFPPEWGPVSVPASSEILFKVLDRAAGFAARHITLDPDNALVHRTKAVVDAISTRAR